MTLLYIWRFLFNKRIKIFKLVKLKKCIKGMTLVGGFWIFQKFPTSILSFYRTLKQVKYWWCSHSLPSKTPKQTLKTLMWYFFWVLRLNINKVAEWENRPASSYQIPSMHAMQKKRLNRREITFLPFVACTMDLQLWSYGL